MVNTNHRGFDIILCFFIADVTALYVCLAGLYIADVSVFI